MKPGILALRQSDAVRGKQYALPGGCAPGPRRTSGRGWGANGRSLPVGAFVLYLVLGLVPQGALHASLAAARAERDLGRRSKLALDNAMELIKSVRESYNNGDSAEVAAGAKEIDESVALAWESLVATGKNPRKSPRWFKAAEIETRTLLKKLDTLQRDLSFEDRAVLDAPLARLQKVHDDLLNGLMEGNKK
jgi:hypothetical protein